MVMESVICLSMWLIKWLFEWGKVYRFRCLSWGFWGWIFIDDVGDMGSLCFFVTVFVFVFNDLIFHLRKWLC